MIGEGKVVEGAFRSFFVRDWSKGWIEDVLVVVVVLVVCLLDWRVVGEKVGLFWRVVTRRRMC